MRQLRVGRSSFQETDFFGQDDWPAEEVEIAHPIQHAFIDPEVGSGAGSLGGIAGGPEM